MGCNFRCRPVLESVHADCSRSAWRPSIIMMKRFALVLLTAGLLAVTSAAQTQETPSTTNDNTTATSHRHHRHKKGSKRYANDPRVQELQARQRTEREACKADRSRADCANLKSRQKA